MFGIIPQIFQRAVLTGTPLLFGSTGEILTEKSGHLNLGIPGIMYVGAISSVAGAFFYEQSVPKGTPLNPALAILIPLLSCIIGAMLMGLIYCFLTVTLRANQNVTGLALSTFGIGVGNFFGGSLIKLVDTDVPSIALTQTSKIFKAQIPGFGKLGWFGDMFLSYSFLVYVAIIVALIASYILNKTRMGLHLRAVGENPETADATGVNVTKYKYIATIIGSAIAGLGGLYFVMDYCNGVWSNDGFGERGWLSIALVIFAMWRPSLSIVGSILFGLLYIIPSYIGTIPKVLFDMLPYAVTILVLIITSIKDKKENQPPAGLGIPYFREER